MTLRILAVGDIHLGRLPGSVPSDVAASAGGLGELGPRVAWARTVEAAIEQRVQAVLLLGDVVDDEQRYFEGWSALETGLRKLLDKGIEVVAVAGNHDVAVLPRLAATLSKLRLVGAGGQWEALEIAAGAARILGWSYPSTHPRKDPTVEPRLTELCSTPFTGPTIGMLHGDLDTSRSDYAHFGRARLEATRADAWLLGHIHGPTFPTFARGDTGAVPIGYLGSLTALDPTETGVHGPWLLDFEGARLVAARQLALAPLRWERLSVRVDDWNSPDDFEPSITRALQDFERRERANLDPVRAVGLRIDLVGQSQLHREIRGVIDGFESEDLRPTLGDCQFFVQRIDDRARPAFDLAALARESDPPGLLARRLLALDMSRLDEDARAERSRLLRLAREKHVSTARQRAFVGMGREEVGDEELLGELRAAGLAALEELLATRASAEASE